MDAIIGFFLNFEEDFVNKKEKRKIIRNMCGDIFQLSNGQ